MSAGVSISENFLLQPASDLTAFASNLEPSFQRCFDNVPLAFVAGAVVMSGVLPDVHSYLKWSIAGLLGSSAAGLTQLATTIIRGASTATTAGAGNNVVSSSENVCATIFSLGAILLPLLAIVVVTIILCVLGSRAKRIAMRAAKLRIQGTMK